MNLGAEVYKSLMVSGGAEDFGMENRELTLETTSKMFKKFLKKGIGMPWK